MDEVTLAMLNPAGGLEAPEVHAQRLDSLAGKTICELSNDSWESERTFETIREELRKRFPDMRVIPYTEFPIGVDPIDVDDMASLLMEKGCQAVISGNAG